MSEIICYVLYSICGAFILITKLKIKLLVSKLITFINRPVKVREQGRNAITIRLAYCRNMTEKKDKTTLHLFHDTIICNRCRVGLSSFFPSLGQCSFPALLIYLNWGG